MEIFYPFIHKIEHKKDNEPQPLYVELYPPMEKLPTKEEKEETGIVIIEL